MSKELSPLEAVEKIREINYFEDDQEVIEDCFGLEEYLSIIESALKRLESVDRIGEMFCVNVDKKLKALEIIKEKRVNACEIINSKDVREYNWSIHTPKKYPLTQEEYDLLKEVLL